jgi:hypothetical protein
MTPLQRVHLKIQEISKEYSNIPVCVLVHEFGYSPHITSHLEALVNLELICFTDIAKEHIRLTESGKLAGPSE